ncbi:MAG: adenylate/guanylate cyclase domain-containing protein [Actinomycetota bacterium]
MSQTPKTHYARNGDVSIAYQIVGDGPFDLVVVPGSITHLEYFWTDPDCARFSERFASFARVITFDKRGTGMSDREFGIATLEERMDDVRAVMDAAGSERAAVFGASEGGAMAALFAATHPSRTTALVLYGAFPRVLAAPDWPGVPPEEWDARQQEAQTRFGGGVPLEEWAPSAATPERQAWWGTLERVGASPGATRVLMAMVRDIDIRAVLPTISVPTLVLHRRGDRVVPVLAGHYMASVIPGARLVELPGDDHLPMYGDVDALLGEVEEFLTGSRHEAEPDRVLATVAFTDIVDSTVLAARLGDSEWRRILDRHDDCARTAAKQHSGRVVKTTGDGVLATFDGPARGVRFVAALGAAVRSLGVEIRGGVHTGEVEVRGDDIGGIAVHIASRIASMAGPDEVLSSRTVKDLTAGSGLTFEDRGAHQLKGVPDEWQVYAVSG